MKWLEEQGEEWREIEKEKRGGELRREEDRRV